MKTVAVRVPSEWKAQMERLDVKWSEVLRAAIRNKLDQVERARLLDAYVAEATASPPAETGDGLRAIREDRDGR